MADGGEALCLKLLLFECHGVFPTRGAHKDPQLFDKITIVDAQVMKRARTPLQCAGITKAGRRCSITADSKAIAESGRLACDPLLRGGRFCRFHADIFNSSPAQLPPDAMLFFLESHPPLLETLWNCLGVDGGGAAGKGCRTSRPRASTFSRSSSWR